MWLKLSHFIALDVHPFSVLHFASVYFSVCVQQRFEE